MYNIRVYSIIPKGILLAGLPVCMYTCVETLHMVHVPSTRLFQFRLLMHTCTIGRTCKKSKCIFLFLGTPCKIIIYLFF